MLSEIGQILKNCCAMNCVIGRTQASYFYLLMKFNDKEEVRNAAGKIRAAIEAVRRAGQWRGNCCPVIRAYYTDTFSRDQNSYTHGLVGI